MPEPIRGALPSLIPSRTAVELAARALYEAVAVPYGQEPWDDLTKANKHHWLNTTLTQMIAAGPFLVADALRLVADNREQFGLDALDSMFDFETFAANVSTAASASLEQPLL